MNEVLTEVKPPTDIPKEGESGGKNGKSGKASQDVKAQGKSIKNSKESNMDDKKESKEQDIKKSNHDKSAVAKDNKAAEKTKSKETGFADNVTLEPQSEEHMDMNLIKSSPALMEAYLKVSDNMSGHHGIKRIETKAKIFCDLYEKIDWEKEKNPEKLLKELKIFTANYSVLLNVADNTSLGIAAKSYIRQGIMFCFQKKCVKMMKESWEKWFKENHNPSHLRSVVDRMSVAKIPNVIRYAVFGMTRLKKLKAVIKITADDNDPIHTFLNGKDLVFDPKSDNPIEDFNREVDAAVAESKIKDIEDKKGLDYGIQADLVKKMVMQGIPFDNKVTRNIHLIHENKGDVNNYLKTRYINKGNEFDIIENENKIKGFRKMVAGIKDAVAIFSDDLTKLETVDDDQIKTLEEAIVEIKRLKAL
jgi:hypothetical protein